MIKVLLADKLSQRAVELLEEIPEFEIDIKTDVPPKVLKEIIGEYEAVIVRHTSLPKEVLQDAENLKIIVRAGIDLDNIDVQFAESKNIEVRNTPFATSVTVAEYTIAQMLGIARFIGPAYKSMKEHKWEKELFSKGVELYGKTAGIIGFGRIGREVAKREIAMGMNVVFYDTAEIKTDLKANQVTLKQLLRIADFISIHIPSNESTMGIIGAAEFDRMKENTVLINTARGGVVDEVSLLNALNDNKLKAVAVDVAENQMAEKLTLINHEKVFPAPFLGSATVEGQERAGLDVIAELKDFFNV